MQRVTVKTSTIFIAKGGKTQVFRSVSEVPPRLRKELEESKEPYLRNFLAQDELIPALDATA